MAISSYFLIVYMQLVQHTCTKITDTHTAVPENLPTSYAIEGQG